LLSEGAISSILVHGDHSYAEAAARAAKRLVQSNTPNTRLACRGASTIDGGDFGCGSKAEKLQLTKCFPLFSQQRTFCIRRRHVADCKLRD
jgi:hypothetical protein